MNKARLLWIDLEMTGLDPEKDRIIEVGAIATDWDFREIASYESGVKIDERTFRERTISKFFDEIGNEKGETRREILGESSRNGKPGAQVERELIEFCEQNFAKISDLSEKERKQLSAKSHDEDFAKSLDKLAPIYLCGNSIHQDQKFIEREWPNLQKILHYRQLDVSSWKLIMENRGVIFAKPEDHRALADIEGSIAELKFYLNKMGLK